MVFQRRVQHPAFALKDKMALHPVRDRAKWQTTWNQRKGTLNHTQQTTTSRYYVSEVFPLSVRPDPAYVRNYTMGDVIAARYRLATGHNVLHPWGLRRLWDAR
jgi:leucyl-tRNA synthetase